MGSLATVRQERGEPCLLPVVVREVSDEHMLTIGAQENLQRQDLDPVEEAQIVAWHERLFFDKNQAEIGAMLGKSSDWVSLRSRIHKLSDSLKERLRQRPRAISQMLELGTLYAQQPEEALELAERVVQENLTLDGLRTLIRGYSRPERGASALAPSQRRGAATDVQKSTSKHDERSGTGVCEEQHEHRGAATHDPTDHARSSGVSSAAPTTAGGFAATSYTADGASSGGAAAGFSDLAALQEAAATLTVLAARAAHLPAGAPTFQALEQAERALAELRRALTAYGTS